VGGLILMQFGRMMQNNGDMTAVFIELVAVAAAVQYYFQFWTG